MRYDFVISSTPEYDIYIKSSMSDIIPVGITLYYYYNKLTAYSL